MRYIYLLLCLVVSVGCSSINVKYAGDELPEIERVTVATVAPDGSKLLGKAIASSKAGNITRINLEDALIDRAKAVGAAIMVITNYQVKPEMANRLLGEDSREVWGNEGAETSNWNQLEKDFNGGYGSAEIPIFGRGSSEASQPVAKSYVRIMYADFYSH